MTANFAKNLPRAHARQAEVCAFAATEFEPGNCRASLRGAAEISRCNEIFGDLNQETRKTGGDQEFLEAPGFVASRLNLVPAFMRDNLS